MDGLKKSDTRPADSEGRITDAITKMLDRSGQMLRAS
jgi:hypothetical protein